MSDRELVTIDPKQLTALEMLLGNIASTLGDKLAHVERTLHTGLGAIAQGGGAGDSSQVLLAIQALNDKVDALALSIKEDNNTQIRALADDVKGVREKLQTSIDNQAKGD